VSDDPTSCRAEPVAWTPTDDDLALLRRLADGSSVAAVGDELGRPVLELAARLAALRRRYGVASTRAALERAVALGHLAPAR